MKKKLYDTLKPTSQLSAFLKTRDVSPGTYNQSIKVEEMGATHN